MSHATFYNSMERGVRYSNAEGEDLFPFVSIAQGQTSFISKSHCSQFPLHQAPPLAPSYQLTCLKVLSLSGFKLC